jgi:hypothetical protein
MINKTKSFGILLAATLLYVVLLSHSTAGPIPQMLKPALAKDASLIVKKGLAYINMPTSNSGGNKSAMASNKNASTNIVQLSANEKKEVYTWVNKDGTNPILNFKLNTENIVQLKNPTDSKHQLMITSAGKEVASSGDIQPGKSGELTFAKLSQGESLGYHCLYHPTTMKGTITISS